MAKRDTTPKWLVPAILVTGAIALFAKAGQAKPASTSPSPNPLGNVQTATVGNRVYSVNRLGQGTYLVTLISTGGVIELAPVNFTFNQNGPLADFGDPAKLAQLKADLNSMQVKFKDTAGLDSDWQPSIGTSAGIEGALIGGGLAILLVSALDIK